MNIEGKKVKITKITGKADSSIPLGATVTGRACRSKMGAESPEIGTEFHLSPIYSSWDHARYDWFSTTEVKELIPQDDGSVMIRTQNSDWKLELI